MRGRVGLTSLVVAAIVTAGSAACVGTGEGTRLARFTLVIGIDVSGSFRDSGHYEDSIEFAAHYLYGHLNGLGGLRVPSAVFVGSVGGERPGEAKSYQPIHAFQGKSVEEIAASLREQYPSEEAYTDFNIFFDRVASLVKRQGLILAPLNIVVLSDGVHDVTGRDITELESPYSDIELSPLEYLSRSVTVRLLYASPTVSVEWERQIKRRRVRMWTVDAQVMGGWREQLKADIELGEQEDFWKWVSENVDFRVRSRRF